MKRLRLSLVAALAGGVLLGCSVQQRNTGSTKASSETTPTRSQAQPSAQSSNAPVGGHDHAAETAVTRISITEAQAAAGRGEAVFLDVRQPVAFSAGRIKGAISMPEAEIPSRAGTLPKDKKIITYCS